jgi:hypothetical protein
VGGEGIMTEQTIEDGFYRCVHDDFAAYSFGEVVSLYKFEDGYKLGPHPQLRYKFDSYYIFEVYKIHDPEYWIRLTDEEVLIYKMAKEG